MNEPELNSRGFTLIELMVTLAIIAVGIGIVVPSLGTMFQNNKMTANVNDFVSALNLARSEAITRTVPVTVCRSARSEHASDLGSEIECNKAGTNWEDGWIVFVDRIGNGDGIPDLSAGSVDTCTDTADCLLTTFDGLSGNYTLRTTGADSEKITFNPTGSTAATNDAPLTTARLQWQLCGPDKSSVKSRGITLNGTGRAVLTNGSNDSTIAASSCPTS